MSKQLLEVYSAWYCPFAARAWIAAEEVLGSESYKLVEVDPYNKSHDNPLYAVNPRLLVPALRTEDGNGTVVESAICVDYIDDKYDGGLWPTDAYERARFRVANDVAGRVVSNFYKTLRQDHADKEAFEKQSGEFLQAIRDWLAELVAIRKLSGDGDSPFADGRKFSVLDLHVFPFAYRASVLLQHYRNFAVPDTDEFAAYHRWYNAVVSRPSVAATQPDVDKLIDIYVKYAKPAAN
jgi:glutathione S-transferase